MMTGMSYSRRLAASQDRPLEGEASDVRIKMEMTMRTRRWRGESSRGQVGSVCWG
jgi:hypothetical protein